MREIIFRGKRADNGEWVEGWLMNEHIIPKEQEFTVECRNPQYFVDTDKLELYEIIPSTIGQYTGLCDKNDTKIFEGDILRLCGDGYDWNGIVVFGRTTSDEDNLEDYGYGWQLDKITKDEPVYTKILLWVEAEADGIDCEIIGNIHDNSDLLNK